MFQFIASVSPATERAWDCATGNGQAARGLARHFQRVDATDASAEQVEVAQPDPRVHYSVAPAEGTAFAAKSFDAVCVASALHWFDVQAFHREAHRVLRPRGVFAAWGYDSMQVSGGFEAAFGPAVLEPIRRLWPPHNRLLWRGYRDLPFPYDRIEAPAFAIELRWTLAQLVDYVGTWTAVKRYMAPGHPDFLEKATEALRPAWPGGGPQRVVMPLHFICGRVRGG